MSQILTLPLLLLLASAVSAPGVLSHDDQYVLQRVATEIRTESLLPPNGSQGRPLPLVSHWNMGSQGKGWTPQYQIELLRSGHRILPWFAWPQGDPEKDERTARRFDDYYAELISICRQFRLPISFRGTQWEAMLIGKQYRALPPQQCPAVIDPNGKPMARLSPFGPVDPWRDPAGAYIDTPAMKRFQRMYPDPPLVLLLSNNEAAKLRWHQVHSSKRYLEQFGSEQSDEFKRKVVSQGWMQRYRVMFDAMRGALVSDTWKQNVRFVGYGAFGPSHFGRWAGWKEYSLITDQWTSPDWLIWQGGSPSYYTHNWCPNRDHWVWSTQVESMNWIFQLEEAFSVNPDFWWEVSLWDGNGGGWTFERGYVPALLAESKACQYLKDGQTYTPERYEGWAQCGLWLLRPRVLREFRGSTVPLEPWRPFFDRLLASVDRIYESETLARFWRRGSLVPNRAHPHPFQSRIPNECQDRDRWFALETSVDPPRPWSMQTDIPVFSLALVTGQVPQRRWLLYAHSPLKDRRDVEITIPGFGVVTVDVPRAGAFHTINEPTRRLVGISPADD